MNINTSQLLALLLAIGVIMLYIFGVERDYSFVTKDVNEYDKLMVRNKKSNRIKKSIISGSNVEWVEEESYFFRLSKWQEKLIEFKK